MADGARSRHRKALLFGLDGIGWHSLNRARTPNLDRLGAAGAIYPVRVDDRNPTISAPVWSTVLTGVEGDVHQVMDNLDKNHKLRESREIMEQLADTAPDIKTFAAATWPTLLTDRGSGPVLREGGYVPDPKLSDVPADWARSDEKVQEYALKKLDEGYDFGFVYFGQSDCTAHNLGTGIAYIDAIERCDSLMGPLLDWALDEHGKIRDDWAVVAVTDHGHKDGGGHGGNSRKERASWIATAGLNSVQDDPSTPEMRHSQITPSIVKFLTGS